MGLEPMTLTLNFNSHARVGRDLALFEFPFAIEDFNSHARVGRDALAYSSTYSPPISTHTPV